MRRRDSLRPAKLVQLFDDDANLLRDRIVERSQGCFNCSKRADHEAVIARFIAMTGMVPGCEREKLLAEETGNRQLRRSFHAKLGAVMQRLGMTESEGIDHLLREKTLREGRRGELALAKLIADRKITYCTVDATTSPGAFIPITYLCGDSNGTPCKWVGVSGTAEARAPGEASAKPYDEVVDTLDHAVKMRNRKLTGDTAE